MYDSREELKINKLSHISLVNKILNQWMQYINKAPYIRRILEQLTTAYSWNV